MVQSIVILSYLVIEEVHRAPTSIAGELMKEG